MSTVLDPQYSIATSLEQYYVDKTTGLPLAAGKVYFYSDVNRTTLKPVYSLTENSGVYTYTQIPNPMTLTAVGTSSDGMGNDIVVYYKPYDSNNNIELYFVEVFDSLGNFQWSRSAWPNLIGSSTNAESLINYIPNGQFLLHNDIAATNTTPAGRISQDITYIAQGGWSFERPSMSTATDSVTFQRLEPVTNPTGNPRYVIRIANTSPSSGDAYKYLAIKFPDVNSFTSEDQEYTFAFTAQTNTSNSLNVDFKLKQYYGVGGSPTNNPTITTFTINSSYTISSEAFSFPSNIGKTIGVNNDDYVQLLIGLPVSSIFDVSMTDFMLTVGNVTILLFPDTTNGEMITFSTAGYLPTPAYDGSDLYLPLKITQQGIIADQSEVGTIVGKVEMSTFTNSISTVSNELLCDGSTYQTNLTSPLGIPYSRLQAKLFNSTYSVPIFGTGPAFVTANVANLLSGSLTEFHISTNSPGPVTDSVDVNTGFTITDIHKGLMTGYISGMASADFFYAKGIVIGASTGAQAGNSGFNVENLELFSNVRTLFAISTVTIPTASHYWQWQSTTGPTNYYMWFKIDGTGTDPAPGGTGTEVDLLSTYSINEVTGVISQALNGSQITKVIATAASTISSGDYFNFNTLTNNYYVWYKKDGTGTDPAPSNKIGILVNILGTDTAVQVASKTVIAINMFSYATPQFQGVFLRGFDPNKLWDYDAAVRFGLNNISAFFGDILGTVELDSFLSHLHGITDSGHIHTYPGNSTVANADENWQEGNATGGAEGNIAFVSLTGNIASNTQTASAITGITVNTNGGTETRPVNNNVVWVIKY